MVKVFTKDPGKEMKKVYRGFKGRQTQRRIAFVCWFALLAFFILFGAIINSNLKWFFGTWLFIAFLTTISCLFYIMTRSWADETIEMSIFVNLYEAFEDLELCPKKDDKSRFHLTKAKNHVEEAINHLSNFYFRKPLSNLFEREFVEPIERLKENLRTIVLPRITQQRDIEKMLTVLRSLAETFSEALKPISLEDITIMNEQIEQYKTRGVTITIESKPKETFVRRIRQSTIGYGVILASLLALGYGVILVICFIYVNATEQGFMIFVKDRPDIVILGGLTIFGIISGIFAGITFWKTK